MKIESTTASLREIQNFTYWVMGAIANRYDENVPDLARRDSVLNCMFLSLTGAMSYLSNETAEFKAFLQISRREN